MARVFSRPDPSSKGMAATNFPRRMHKNHHLDTLRTLARRSLPIFSSDHTTFDPGGAAGGARRSALWRLALSLLYILPGPYILHITSSLHLQYVRCYCVLPMQTRVTASLQCTRTARTRCVKSVALFDSTRDQADPFPRLSVGLLPLPSTSQVLTCACSSNGPSSACSTSARRRGPRQLCLFP